MIVSLSEVIYNRRIPSRRNETHFPVKERGSLPCLPA